MPERTLTIYTLTDSPKKKPETTTQILLTLTPANLSQSHTPVAWKILTFPPDNDVQKSVKLHTSVGFSSVTVVNGDCVRSGVDITVQAKHMTSLKKDTSGKLWWTDPVDLKTTGDGIAARNESGRPRSFALCIVDDFEDKYETLVHLGTVENDQGVETGLPIMLQAYALSDYKEGKLLSAESQKAFLFSSWKNEPQPIDISGFGKNVTFQLYLDASGKIMLENQN